MNASSYLIDFEGNLWTFGYNQYGQLGHGNKTHIFNKYLMGSILLPKTLKIKYLAQEITITDNSQQETLNHFQLPKKSIHNIPPGETNFTPELKVQGNK